MAELPEAPSSMRRGPAIAPVALVLILALAVAAAFVLFDDGTTSEQLEAVLVPGVEDEFYPMAPSQLPEGIELTAARRGAGFGGEFEQAEMSATLYGAPNSETPFAEADLAVFSEPVAPEAADVVTEDAIAEDLEMFGGHEVDVGGERAFVSDGFFGRDIRMVSWEPQPDLSVMLASASLDDDALVEIAESVEVDEDGLPVIGDVPSGLAPLTDGGEMGHPGIGLGFGETYHLMFGPPAPLWDEATIAEGTIDTDVWAELSGLNVTVSEAGPYGSLTMDWLLAASGEPDVQVGGSPAVVHDLAAVGGMPGSMLQLSWVEPGGPWVSLMGMGLDQDELLATAESMQRLDSQEWEELVTSLWLDDVVELASGTDADGPWRLSIGQPGESDEEHLCTEGAGYSECYELSVDPQGEPANPAEVVVAHYVDPWDGVVSGWAAPEIFEVALVHSDEVLDRFETVEDPWDVPVRYFRLTGLPMGGLFEMEQDYELVAYGADGEELDRVESAGISAIAPQGLPGQPLDEPGF